MEERLKLRLLFYFTAAYMLFFTASSLLNKNYEFLFYTLIMGVLIFIIASYRKALNLTSEIVTGLAILGAVHIFGGNIYVQGTRLYDLWIVSDVLRYDNVVHTLGGFISAMVGYNIMLPHISEKLRNDRILMPFTIVIIASGIGAFNEIIELMAVLFLNAADKVGDYMNNAFDLVFNLIGSLIAVYFLNINSKKNIFTSDNPYEHASRR